MGPEPMLSSTQRETFEDRGLVRLKRAFSLAQAQAMEQRLWTALTEGYGASPDDPATWQPGWATGLQDLRADEVFEPIGGAAVTGALDELLGVRRWQRPRHWGQVLVSFPATDGAWAPPTPLWHTDFAYDVPATPLAGVLVFSFISTVVPRTGGTGVMTGSHRLVREFVERQRPEVLRKMKTARTALMRSEPWLHALSSIEPDLDWLGQLRDTEHVLYGTTLRIEELVGEAGDVVIAHPWLLHSPAPNRGSRPRFMRVQRIHAISPRPPTP
jgi:hypothetical protein